MVGFVGRRRELQAIDRSVKRLTAGEGGIVEIRGEPGIGKTRLLYEAGQRAARSGVRVSTGSTGELERDIPFGVFVDALDDDVARVFSTPVRGRAPSCPEELGAVFPSLARLVSKPAEPLAIERYRVHQAVRALIEAVAARQPLILALDDLHWADEASIGLLSYLLRHPPRAALLLMVAYRPRQAPSRLLAALNDQPVQAAVRIELEPLSIAEASELLDARLDEPVRQAIYRESGGNPLYLEALAGAAERDGPNLTSRYGLPDDHEVLEGVRSALLAELRALPSSTLAVARAAAVVGDAFAPELVAAVLETDEAEVLAGLDELYSRDIVRALDVPRRFRFRHPTVRRAIYGSAPAGWRLAAHGRLAVALAALEIPPAGLAHHVEKAARVGDEQAIAILVEAGSATTTTAPSTAARWFAAALRLVPPNDRTLPDRLELHVALARALGAAGRLEECCAALRDALDLTTPDQSELRSELIASFGMAEHLLGRHELAHDRLLHALDEILDEGSPEAVALQMQLAVGAFFRGDYATMAEWARPAYRSSQALGRHPLHVSAASILAVAEYSEGRIARSVAYRRQAADMVDELPDEMLLSRLDVFLYLGQVEHSLGYFDDAVRHLDRGLLLCRRTGQSFLVPALQVVKTVALIFQGRLDEAAELAENAHEGALLLANQHFQTLSGVVRVWTARSRGELVEAVAVGEGLTAMADSCGAMIFAFAGLYLAEALLELGEADSARQHLLVSAGGPELKPIERSLRPWGYEVLIRAELMLGEVDGAAGWLRRAEDCFRDVELDIGRAYLERAQAAVSLAQGDVGGAVKAALEAAGSADRAGVPVEAARARILAAQGLRALGRNAEAVTELLRAEQDLARCGARRYRDEAAQELRLLGQRVPVRARPAPRRSTVGALTTREREVAELVVAGHTNRQIASALYVSESTVETHLKHIFRKLGISSRASLAAVTVQGREPSLR